MVIKLTINGRFLTQPITGVQRYAREFVTTLDRLLALGEVDRQIWQVRLLHPPQIRPPALSLTQIAQQAVGRFWGHWWEQVELPQAVSGEILFCPGNSAPIAHLWRASPTVVTVHDLSFRYFPTAYSPAYRLLYSLMTPLIMRSASVILTVSETERQSILRYYPQAKNRIHAVHNGGLPQPLVSGRLVNHHNPESPSSRPFVLFVGALSRRKNLPGVLQAVAQVNREQPLDLVIVGAGSQGLQLGDLDLPTELGDRIRFTGQISDQELLRYYQAAHCLVFPSYFEASGLPPIEAMACGCPVIASNIPALVERCGEAALYCHPDDINGLAEAMLSLLPPSGVRAELVQQGYERAAQFTWENCVQQTLAIIEACLTQS